MTRRPRHLPHRARKCCPSVFINPETGHAVAAVDIRLGAADFDAGLRLFRVLEQIKNDGRRHVQVTFNQVSILLQTQALRQHNRGLCLFYVPLW